MPKPPCSPRLRMLNAYCGQRSDLRPVAPEFWYFVPAKVIGIDMVTFERQVPLWRSLWETFKHYDTEGWCIVSPDRPNPAIETHSQFVRIAEGHYEDRVTTRTRHGTLTSARRYSLTAPPKPRSPTLLFLRGDSATYPTA